MKKIITLTLLVIFLFSGVSMALQNYYPYGNNNSKIYEPPIKVEIINRGSRGLTNY